MKRRRQRGFASAHLIHESGGVWLSGAGSNFPNVLTSVLLLIIGVQICLCLSPYDAAQWVTVPSTPTFGFLCIVYPANSFNVVRYLYKNGQSWPGQLSTQNLTVYLWCEPINVHSLSLLFVMDTSLYGQIDIFYLLLLLEIVQHYSQALYNPFIGLVWATNYSL